MIDIDAEVLQKAMENVARERFRKELREAVAFGPKILGDVFKEYERLQEMPTDDDYLAALGPCGK